MKIKHVFNYILKGSKIGRGKINLAKAAIVEDSNRNLHFVMLCPKSVVDSGKDPEAYLRSEMFRTSACG